MVCRATDTSLCLLLCALQGVSREAMGAESGTQFGTVRRPVAVLRQLHNQAQWAHSIPVLCQAMQMSCTPFCFVASSLAYSYVLGQLQAFQESSRMQNHPTIRLVPGAFAASLTPCFVRLCFRCVPFFADAHTHGA